MLDTAFLSPYTDIILCVVSFVVAWMSYPMVLGFARKWNVVDNPDARKLHRNPVPVLGGVSVFIGLVVGVSIMLMLFYQRSLLVMLLAMGALLVVGFTDDKYGLPIWMRFLLEILVVMAMIVFNGNMIDNFYGLFGLHAIPTYVALPLSVFTGVGIINAINLIDGVDGYSCGYISITCLSFSVIFYYSQIYTLFSLCLICACSVVPFFLHNVFGVKSKMFIGDGGTLMLGTLMVVLAFSMLRTGSMCETLGSYNISLVALCLAELALPVIDTLRVMTRRMVNGMSPFKPDKTHLHHLFIDLNFPHFIAGFICILLNVVVMVTWLVSWIMGAEANIQFAVVCVSMVLVDPILYNVLRYHERHNTCLYHQIRRFAGQMNPETTRFWKWMNHWIDNELY